ncbi:MAG: VWA domain-containing protein, partial [Deltaproteobacteria bacterium]|nr:VWA domain-containing protein [Deltaproteobacteria bacterium]
ERERLVMLLVDMSASGGFGTTDALKKEVAVEAAAILAFNAIRSNDKVGAILFTDQVEKYIPPQKGAAHVWRVIKEIYIFEPVHRKTDIECAIRYLGRVCRKRSLSFLISDYLADGFARPLKIAAKKHELIGILISDPGEFSLPEGGLLLVEDFESGQQFTLDAQSDKTRKLYAKARRAQYDTARTVLKEADIDCIAIDTDSSVPDALMKYFRYREKKKR